MINVDVTYNLSALDKATRDHLIAILKGLSDGMLEAETWSKRSFNAPGHLKVRTGNLRRSIKHYVAPTSDGAVGVLYTQVKYGRYHELPLMRYRDGSPPGSKAFLRPAVEARKEFIARRIMKEIAKI